MTGLSGLVELSWLVIFYFPDFLNSRESGNSRESHTIPGNSRKSWKNYSFSRFNAVLTLFRLVAVILHMNLTIFPIHTVVYVWHFATKATQKVLKDYKINLIVSKKVRMGKNWLFLPKYLLIKFRFKAILTLFIPGNWPVIPGNQISEISREFPGREIPGKDHYLAGIDNQNNVENLSCFDSQS